MFFTLLQKVRVILGGRGLKGELPLNRRDSRIISTVNFDLNLIMNAFFFISEIKQKIMW